jgi:hypothetical protein
MFKNGMRPVHPGDFLKPLGMSVNALAKALNVPTPRINDVVRKRRGVSADARIGVYVKPRVIARGHFIIMAALAHVHQMGCGRRPTHVMFAHGTKAR